MSHKSIIKLNKFDIAVMQLHTAIDLFLHSNYICAITLAGAAEEILGKYASHTKNCTAHSLLIEGLVELYKEDPKWLNDNVVNHDRNHLKHHDSQTDDSLEIDPKFSAIVLIVRAIHNFKVCGPPLTAEMESFVEWLQANMSHVYEGKYVP